MKSKIKTFEDACEFLKIETTLPEVSALPIVHQKAIIAFYKLTIITQALNDGWIPDWNNFNEWKYFNWFEIDADKERPSGFGFSDSGSPGTDSVTHVGSRLCFKSRELANYAREEFKELYQDYLLIQ